jgi:hypothetical protein
MTKVATIVSIAISIGSEAAAGADDVNVAAVALNDCRAECSWAE